ncbi:MAG: hypothetical protein RR588_09610 [Solibacillus sp.]
MRLLDQERDVCIKDIVVLLTYEEAFELRADLDQLLESKRKDFHVHLDDKEYKREITIALYEEGKKYKNFNERINQLICEDL